MSDGEFSASGSSGSHEFAFSRKVYFQQKKDIVEKKPLMPEVRRQINPLYIDRAQKNNCSSSLIHT
jgi:hypothetical protein